MAEFGGIERPATFVRTIKATCELHYSFLIGSDVSNSVIA